MKRTIDSRELSGELMLLGAAFIWGLSFVSQRVAVRFMEPFNFNAARYLLGALCLLPVLFIRRTRIDLRTLASGALAGLVLCTAAALQQFGCVTTSAGNAGFITGLYVILVPLFSLFLRRNPGLMVWIGSVLAVAGLYVLSVGPDFTMSPGDLLVLVGAVFWAIHILIVGRFGAACDSIAFSVVQFTVCGLLSLGLAAGVEGVSLSGWAGGWAPILYSGVFAVGGAFTLQVLGQKRAHPARASLVMSLESLFAALGGILLLGEPLTLRVALGSLLMLAGMMAAQLQLRPHKAVTA